MVLSPDDTGQLFVVLLIFLVEQRFVLVVTAVHFLCVASMLKALYILLTRYRLAIEYGNIPYATKVKIFVCIYAFSFINTRIHSNTELVAYTSMSHDLHKM